MAQVVFAPSSVHTAHVPFQILQGAGVTVTLKFFLSTKQNPTGPADAANIYNAADIQVTVTGAMQTVNVPVTMPATLPSSTIYACGQIIYQSVPVLSGVDTATTIVGTFGSIGPITWD